MSIHAGGSDGERIVSTVAAGGAGDAGRPSPRRVRAPMSGVAAADVAAAAVLTGLIALVAWNRLAFDSWLSRFDLSTFFLPWYAFLGERLRAFDVPGWNPHLFSGTPFAGDPESGWMYLPAMVVLPLFSVLTAFKAMVAVQLTIAGLSTYAFARVLGMGAIAALVAALVYVFGPFLQWNTDCCLIFSQFATWIPLALLGVDLAVRAQRWRDRVVPWFATGFAVSQMLAGWVGEGWYYAILLVAAYTGYRALLSPPRPGLDLRERLTLGATTGAAGLGLGLAIGAAGVLPRLAVNAEANLAGANYGELGRQGILNPPWRLDYLLAQILGSGYDQRRAALGGAALVLALLAPVLARRRFAVPFFATLTVVALILALDTTPLHRLFYLIPQYRTLHEHDPWRSVSLATIGPALLSGATVESLRGWRGRRRLLPIVVAPLLLLAIVAAVLRRDEVIVGGRSLIAAAVATGLVTVVVAAPRREQRRRSIDGVVRWVPVLLVVVAFVQPTGLELSGSWLGWPRDPSWQGHWTADPGLTRAVAIEASRTDAGGAGEFLQARYLAAGPFRQVGYSGPGYPGDAARQDSYMGRRFEPGIQAVLVNGRPMMLGLDEIQGYDPLQLARYVELMNAVNGATINYHVAFLLPSGVKSRLLDLLDVRYVLIDASLPQGRDDVVALTAGQREVFRNGQVIVYERTPMPAHAWIVHDVRAVTRGEALPLLTSGKIDPRRTALVEGNPPAMSAPPEQAAESTQVTHHAPDALTIATKAAAPGLLVVSEIYEEGWRAYVDGKRVEVLPTDHALRGVPVPAGEHTVEIRYEPLALRLGLPISGVSTLAMLIVFAVAGWARLRRGGRAAATAAPA